MPTRETRGKQGEMRRWQRGRSLQGYRGDEEGAESSPQGRLEASKERWRNEEIAERQRGIEEPSRRDGR